MPRLLCRQGFYFIYNFSLIILYIGMRRGPGGYGPPRVGTWSDPNCVAHLHTQNGGDLHRHGVVRGFYLARSLPATCQTRINVPFVTDGDYRAAI